VFHIASRSFAAFRMTTKTGFPQTAKCLCAFVVSRFRSHGKLRLAEGRGDLISFPLRRETPHRAAAERPAENMTDHTWTVRVERVGEKQAKAYTRNHAFVVGEQAGFEESDPHPSAVEYLLGALGGDLLRGLEAQAARRRVAVDGLELRLTGRLNNPLTHLGVIGEAGHPGLESVEGTLYVSGDADAEVLEEMWQETLARSPLFHTLRRGAEVKIELRVML